MEEYIQFILKHFAQEHHFRKILNNCLIDSPLAVQWYSGYIPERLNAGKKKPWGLNKQRLPCCQDGEKSGSSSLPTNLALKLVTFHHPNSEPANVPSHSCPCGAHQGRHPLGAANTERREGQTSSCREPQVSVLSACHYGALTCVSTAPLSLCPNPGERLRTQRPVVVVDQ